MFMSERLKRTVAVTTLASLGTLAACGGPTHAEASFNGGCSKYGVYAQNRWAPLGTAIRVQPNVLSPQIGSFEGDTVIAVNGWIHTDKEVYPTNTPPWNSNIWFHLANQNGWVSFAGVRGAPTAPDPTGLANGGEPAPTPQDCEGTYHD